MSVRIKFEPRDLWIGLYLDHAARTYYLCIVPMLPIIVRLSTEVHDGE